MAADDRRGMPPYRRRATRRDGRAIGHDGCGECDVGGWRNARAVVASSVHMATNTGNAHTVGLRFDGTVIATGWNTHHQWDLNDWRRIVSIAAGWRRTIGLTANGRAIATGGNRDGDGDVARRRDIFAVAAGYLHTSVSRRTERSWPLVRIATARALWVVGVASLR